MYQDVSLINNNSRTPFSTDTSLVGVLNTASPAYLNSGNLSKTFSKS